jgi:hypothetical protein
VQIKQYLKIISDLNQAFDSTKEEVGVDVSLVDLVQNQNIVTSETRISRYLTQQKAFCEKENASFVRLVFLETNLIPDLVTVLVESLEPDPVG